MVFSSVLFLFVFLPLFLLGNQFLGSKLKNYWILVASLLFYSWGAPVFIWLALASIFIDYFLVLWLNKKEGNERLILLWLSIVLNVGLLLYFKYSNFFIENLNVFLGKLSLAPIIWAKVALPIGISFYTFQKISYSIDIYRKYEKPLSNLADYTLYILLFPQLIAGPIVRFNEIASQIRNRNNQDYSQKLNGIFRFSIGLGKKVIIANEVGRVADLIFNSGLDGLSSSLAWLGIICYTFQIYFDFSGYSDMAIGLGKMMGFEFPENFNAPYIAKNITEFWRRWHITLGSWMRDYLYIPLGGNKVKSQGRLYLNLWLVFLISGFWHGAAWTFVLWGAYHGVFLIMDRLFLNKLLKKWPSILKTLLTFFIAINGWVLFRTEELGLSIDYYSIMYNANFEDISSYFTPKLSFTLVLAILISFGFLWKKAESGYWNIMDRKGTFIVSLKFIFSISILLIAAGEIISSDFNPFIYFRF